MKENRGVKKIKIRPGLFTGSLTLIILRNLTYIYYIYIYIYINMYLIYRKRKQSGIVT